MKSNRERQAEFSKRKCENGYKKTTVWINEKDFLAGFEAGLQKYRPDDIPEECDTQSWVLGYLNAKEKLKAKRFENMLSNIRYSLE